MTALSRTHLTAALALGAAALVSSPTWAQEALTITVAVANTCSVESGTIDFGTYNRGQINDMTAVGNIDYTSCPAGTIFKLSFGNNADGTQRKMEGPGLVEYNLYQNEGRTALWDNDGYTLPESAAFSGSIPVYGVIPGGQTAAAGNYQDYVEINLTF